ncbi:MAG: polyprenyl synthetase family protein [Clostridium sp.]|nr:polyprenyl synthetase family protein [Clostridium sp.]
MERTYSQQVEHLRQLANERLDTYFCGEGLEEAMKYSLMAGGKRIRPILTMAFCQAAGGQAEEALDFACGVEMLHTYSLIHDDLPCMDNDDLRRGKPTCHKQFNECIATLAGDALQAAAFRTILFAWGPWREGQAHTPLFAAGVLATAVGEHGMCGGQYLDTIQEKEPRTVEELTAIHNMKTGALLRAACILGVLASFGRREFDDNCVDVAREYAENLGLAFQIRDDILDATAATQTLGKPAGSDAANGKTTYVTLLGVEACEKLVQEYTQKAKDALELGDWQGDTEFLRWLADELATRDH